ncbi:mitochondrial chaperone BCS1 [Pyrus ussuriensis x Pyrus communis]|uniref:Mitochondrial chaperone BCS1 n=1 Tax=Pyrus ussuriensis x Pyrus communis TaxID=2448454 RepID=A0A5N5GDJ3_9ROSA|nr:mitochondrial chaperone BCS1 [Pyrus ussuriensis x Pyrus communis]
MNVDAPDRAWKPVLFIHPSTLETTLIEFDFKSKVKSDLESFLKTKQYYHRLGRVWKWIKFRGRYGEFSRVRRVRSGSLACQRQLGAEDSAVVDDNKIGHCDRGLEPIYR